jgi:uncharacterized protein (DUF1800 family)
VPLGEANARHLLRRTEFVDKPDRVAAIEAMDVDAAVDNILNTASAGYSSLSLGSGENWQQGQNITRDWLNRMAGRSGGSPFRERMAFFWHGHICSELGKVNSAPFMREQIDLFREDGVNGTIGQLMKDMSLQVAMLRYLDNDRNVATSPNQNFAREMMELFVIGVGNYTETEVESATSAWTGHTAVWNAPGGNSDAVRTFNQEQHTRGALPFFGRTINQIQFRYAGFETIDVMLWLNATYASGTGGSTSYASQGGIVPNGADNVANRGRPTKEVAAEFLSKKLWQEFGEANSGTVPPGVLGAMTTALLNNNFQIRPWVRAMLMHDDFYAESTKNGLVRQPVEYMVALMVALGRSAEQVAALWLMGQAGQELLYPPNVSGWKPNGFWINASAFEGRNRLAQACTWPLFETYWAHPWQERHRNYFELQNGQRIHQHEVVGGAGLPAPHDIAPLPNDVLVDRILDFMGLTVRPETRAALIDFCESHTSGSDPNYYERRQLPLLIMLAPDLHVSTAVTPTA